MSFRSVFDQDFDLAVFGAGYAGWAALREGLRLGRSVVWIDSGREPLWESTGAFCPQAGELEEPAWNDFLEAARTRNLFRDDLLDSCGPGILVCDFLRNTPDGLGVLFDAHPVSAQLCDGQVESVQLATKGGLRTIRAAQWIDASEEARLFELIQPGVSRREPAAFQHRLLFAGPKVEPGLAKTLPLPFEPRIWDHEFSLVVEGSAPRSKAELVALTPGLRDSLPDPLSDAGLVQASHQPLPIYRADPDFQSPTSAAPNLAAASPCLSANQVSTLADRFALGLEAVRSFPESSPSPSGKTEVRTLPARDMECDVLVAGAGTGGCMAAVAAAKAGARTLLLESSSNLGGIGTAALISGYFHGHPGGEFHAVDRAAAQTRPALDPAKYYKSGWHPEAKTAAIQGEFQAQNVEVLTGAVPFVVEVSDGRVTRVRVVASKEILEISAKCVVDSSGDGDLAALAGAEWVMGRPGDGFPLAYSLTAIISEFKEDGVYQVRGRNYDAGWVDATDPEDLTRARITGMAQHLRPRYEQSGHPVFIAPLVGLRQSRHIVTRQTVTLADFIDHRRFPDSIGVARSPLDTHSVDFEFEADEMLFYLWGCKNFRGDSWSEIPYGLLIARGLDNLWIGCRACGVEVSAAYGLRMQRDMQRIGEAAGYAAALAARTGTRASEVDVEKLRELLRETGAFDEGPSDPSEEPEKLREQFLRGEPGGYLWQIYRNRSDWESEVAGAMEYDDPHVSWLAALLLAMWKDQRAEPRLLEAVANKERGVETPASARGAFGQWIDVPNWYLAVVLLRRVGTASALPHLKSLAEQTGNPLNVRTAVALTLASMAPRLSGPALPAAGEVLQALVRDPLPETLLRPSRSLYRTLLGEEQAPLQQEPNGVDTREDHGWRLIHTTVLAARTLGLPDPVDSDSLRTDPRALVRRNWDRLQAIQ